MDGEKKKEGKLGEELGGGERGSGNCDPALKTKSVF